MKNKVGRPKKEKTVVIYIRMPKRLAEHYRARSAAGRRELSATIVMDLERVAKDHLRTR